jgi:hypothetical protein
MIIQPTGRPPLRDEMGRQLPNYRPTPSDLLATVSDSDAKKLLTNFISIRAGLISTNTPKASELSKNSDLNPGSIFNYFSKRHAISASDLPEIIGSVLKNKSQRTGSLSASRKPEIFCNMTCCLTLTICGLLLWKKIKKFL